MSIHVQVAAARRRFRDAGISGTESDLDARLLAQYVLGWTTERFLTDAHAQEPEGFSPQYETLVARRATREPLAYIVGVREFWGLDFQVTPAVLIPRQETEYIVEEVLAILGQLRAAAPGTAVAAPVVRVADIGTGSGCIAIAIAHSAPNVHVVATDISSEALVVARQNAERNGVAGRVEFFTASFLGGIDGDFDVIASNPPYVRELDRGGIGANVRHEPEVALYGGDDGLLHIEAVLDTAVHKLRPHGWLVMEIGLGQEDDVTALVSARPRLAVRRIRNDLQGIARTFVIQREGQ